jgi:hypothetical protein
VQKENLLRPHSIMKILSWTPNCALLHHGPPRWSSRLLWGKKIQALQMQCARAKHSQAQAIAKAQQKQRRQSHTYKMMNRGEYSAGVRKLARAFAKGGCSQEQIGPLIRMTGQTIGVKVKGKLSRRTISRCIREGGGWPQGSSWGMSWHTPRVRPFGNISNNG